MKITIHFGSEGPQKQINWWKELMDFPKALSYNNKKWEWSFYTTDPAGFSDYVLILSQIPSYDPHFYVDMVSFEELFGSDFKCECGAKFSSFEWDHMFYCSMRTPW